MSNLGNKETMSENIAYYLEKSGMDRHKLAEELGVSYSAVSEWLRKASYPRIDKIEKMANIFHVEKSDLVEERVPNAERVVKAKRIPILSSIACGSPSLIEEGVTEYVTEPVNYLPSGEYFYLRAKGESMMPTIPNGSLVLIRRQPAVENNEIAAVVMMDTNEATLKRVKKVGDKVLLLPDNPKFTPIVLDGSSSARIVGKAVRITVEL